MIVDASAMKILVVDDNPGDRALVRTLLRDAPIVGWTVLEASTVEEAVHLEGREGVDVILLDLNLGPTNGLESLRAMRAAAPSIPILVHSGLNDEEMAVEALADGALDYLIKGEETARSLQRLIRMAIERVRLQNEVARQRNTVEAQQEQLRRTDQVVDQALFTVDRDGRVLRANPGAGEIFETGELPMVGTPLARWFQDSELVEEIRATASPDAWRRRTKVCTAMGRVLPVEVIVAPTADINGEAHVIRIRDRSGEVAVAEAMRRLERQYEILLNSADRGILGLDREARITFANPAVAELLSIDRAEVVGKPLQAWLADSSEYSVAEAARDGRSYEGEGQLQRVDGSTVPVRATLSPFDPEAGEVGTVVIFEDLRGERQLREQLRQAQKMEVIGQLAGGIAHDFNNELAIIGLNTSLLNMNAEEGEPIDPVLLEEIRDATDRATRITRQLLTMSRRGEFEVSRLDLDGPIRDLEKLCRKLLPESIDVVLRIDDGEHEAIADAGALNQALLNLCTNARDAMEGNGSLLIALERQEVGPGHRLRGPAGTRPEPGSYNVVSVTDTGCGMPTPLLERIFEPFFTTKEKGRGTGLGLSMVYGIVTQLGGFLDIDSREGVGTCVRIYLPKAIDDVDVATREGPGRWAGDGSGHVVLLVEDEAPLRRAARSILQRHGFTVVEAENGAQALERFESSIDGIDIVVSDDVMPTMTGAELYKTLTSRWGPVPFVLTTGYPADLPAELKDVPLVQKPWQAASLLETLWNELNRLGPNLLIQN